MRKKKSGDQRASENVARSPEGNGRGMMQARKTAIERERRSRQEERVCLRRGENPRGERNLASLPLSPPLFFSPVIPRERENRCEKERTEEASERASTRAEDGCCCCGRGITSAPLTRKTFRLNLVLDSARLLSTHPNRPAFLARPKRSANSPPFPLPPLLPPILCKCYQTAAGPPPNRRHSVPCI